MLRSPLLAPFNHAPAWDRLASLVNPVWSLEEPRGRVVRVVDEAPQVRSLWLRPNGRFRGFAPGQHVMLGLEIAGVRQSRCFSFSTAPRRDGLLRLTIKSSPDGRFSPHAHGLLPGAVVRLGQAMGGFAPRAADAPLLMLAAGSGITPMMSLLHGLAAARSCRDMVLLQVARTADESLFSAELQELGRRLPGLRVLRHVTADAGRPDAGHVARLVPDWRDREALLCGPEGYMALVGSIYAEAGLRHQLQQESFGRRATPPDPAAARHAIHRASGAASFIAQSGQTLLEAAEAAGLSPPSGCRRGICRSCSCLKRSGTVLNQLTGMASGPGEELIQLCISTPQSALELAL
ncbi:ferredoxin reductase [Arenimonas sp. MALMAid1274]|uniref:ferredoxin reductase n=1 Tax=Arenimonas sp. MALMAid1274 TaxID=3411630 RepID=UPI003BA3BD36